MSERKKSGTYYENGKRKIHIYLSDSDSSSDEDVDAPVRLKSDSLEPPKSPLILDHKMPPVSNPDDASAVPNEPTVPQQNDNRALGQEYLQGPNESRLLTSPSALAPPTYDFLPRNSKTGAFEQGPTVGVSEQEGSNVSRLLAGPSTQAPSMYDFLQWNSETSMYDSQQWNSETTALEQGRSIGALEQQGSNGSQAFTGPPALPSFTRFQWNSMVDPPEPGRSIILCNSVISRLLAKSAYAITFTPPLDAANLDCEVSLKFLDVHGGYVRLAENYQEILKCNIVQSVVTNIGKTTGDVSRIISVMDDLPIMMMDLFDHHQFVRIRDKSSLERQLFIFASKLKLDQGHCPRFRLQVDARCLHAHPQWTGINFDHICRTNSANQMVPEAACSHINIADDNADVAQLHHSSISKKKTRTSGYGRMISRKSKRQNFGKRTETPYSKEFL